MNNAARPSTPHRCAVSNTVIGTVASASFAHGLTILARSAVAVGFPCVVVQPFDWFEMLGDLQTVEPLPVPSPPLLPRSPWCTEPQLRHQYGWRRSQLYRARLWRVVLGYELDLLAMDLDHMLNPRCVWFSSGSLTALIFTVSSPLYPCATIVAAPCAIRHHYLLTSVSDPILFPAHRCDLAVSCSKHTVCSALTQLLAVGFSEKHLRTARSAQLPASHSNLRQSNACGCGCRVGWAGHSILERGDHVGAVDARHTRAHSPE